MPVGPDPARAWLPHDAITNGLPVDGVRDALDDWSTKWFLERRVEGVDAWSADSAPPGFERATMLTHDEGLSIVASATTLTALVDLMYSRPAAVKTTPTDDDRLKSAAELCFVDLRRRLAPVFDIADDTRWHAATSGEAPGLRTRSCVIGLNEAHPLVQIVVTEALLIRRIKAALPPPPGADPIVPISTGLAKQSIRLSALLGRCALPLGNLTELTPGDVLVLDRPLHGALELAVDDVALPAAFCRIAQRDDHVVLSLS